MIYLDDYRDVTVVQNYDRPHMTNRDRKRACRERANTNIIYFSFLFAISFVLAIVAYATGCYFLSIFSVAWIIIYYTLVALAATRRPLDDAIYLLVDRMTKQDDDFGTTQCIFVLYQPELNTYCKIEADYHIYRDALIGDWIYMYRIEDDIYVIPEYPNLEWRERRCFH